MTADNMEVTTGFDPHGTYYELARHVDVAPASLPIVLVHGVGMDHGMWDWQLAALGREYPVLRYDLLGHGQTPHRPSTRSLSDYAEQLINLLDYLGVPRLHLVGFSLGALIAQKIAADHGQRLASLVIMNGVYRRNEAELAGNRERLRLTQEGGVAAVADLAMERWFPPEFHARHGDVVARIRERLVSNDEAGYEIAYRSFVDGDAQIGAGFRDLQCPVLAMTGDLDGGSTVAMAERIAADLGHAKVAVLPGLRHMAPVEDPIAVSTAMLGFLRGV